MSRFTLIVALVVLAPAGCGDDDDDLFGPGGAFIGAPCRGDRDCPGRCEEGFCTVACDHDGHCPAGSACIDEHGGICAPLCGGPGACGPGYECRPTDRRGVDGSTPVCRRD